MKLYENIFIGNYLFHLGVQMAKLRPNLDLPLVSVNLLQQTPLDRPLGNVLLANASICRLMKFKRAGQLTRKEAEKLTALRQGLQRSDEQWKFEAVSRQVHWYVEIDEPKVFGKPVISKACPYLDFSDNPKFVDINQFAADTVEEACLIAPDPALVPFRDGYLRWIVKLFAN